ncbi:MAG: ddlA1 [Parachlamydiales bacterium]|nr:ddlA1 [Parachlamydiales bacterium]
MNAKAAFCEKNTHQLPAPAKGKNGKVPVFRTLGPITDLEKHLPPEWWKSLFNSLYLKTDGDVVENPLNTAREVDLLIQLCGIKPSDELLDLCCGQGRHSLEIAKRGFENVIGIDRSRFLIRLAKKRARQMQLRVNFSEGDARRFKLPESSRDCIFMMGNSFGYFERVEDDLAVLQECKRVLKSDGKMLLDLVDGDWMRKHFEPRSWEWINNNHFVCRERSLSADGKRVVCREVIVHAERGVLADQFYAERLYTFQEIEELLAQVGFIDICSHGNVTPDSPRNQDLGMMAKRLFTTARAPKKIRTAVEWPRTQAPARIAVLLGDPRLPDRVKRGGNFNQEDFETVQRMKDALGKLKKFQFETIDDHRTLFKRLLDNPPDFVFNLCDEGFYNNAFHELHVPALLELLNIPYSGAGPACLGLCYNKSQVRAIADALDIPVPLESYIDPSEQGARLPSIFPALLKPNCGDSSLGITQQAVVYNAEELMAQIDRLRILVPGIPILVQEFLQGPEYTVGLIGNPNRFEVLPILEVDYSSLPEDLPKILSYESKWEPSSLYWSDLRYKRANLDEEARRSLIDYSEILFERLECRDFARFDFRADSQGTIKLLEANPNPGWCWDGKMNLMAGMRELDYSEFIGLVLNAAFERIYGKQQ